MSASYPRTLPITVIGSYPKPAHLKLADWFQKGSADCCKTDIARDLHDKQLKATGDEAQKLEKSILRATREIVSEQMDLGVHVPTDGEVRRDNYVYTFCRSLEGMGFEKDQLSMQNIRNTYTCLCPSVVGKLKAKTGRPSVVNEWRAAQALCPEIPIKITIPGPMTICDTVAVDNALRDGIYADREAICADLVPIIRAEVFALVDAGCKHIQIDEPVFARRCEEALSYGIDNLSKIFEGVPAGVVRSVHLCCGYPNHLDHLDYPHAPKENYIRLAKALDECETHWISLEDAHCRNDLAKLLPLFRKKTIIFGSITVHRSKVESVEDIQSRIEEALKYIDAERLVLAPDCGLGFLPTEIRLAKMRNLKTARENIIQKMKLATSPRRMSPPAVNNTADSSDNNSDDNGEPDAKRVKR